MRKEILSLSILIIIVVLGITLKPSWGYSVRDYLSVKDNDSADFNQLLSENAELKSRIAILENLLDASGYETGYYNLMPAFVYSHYPFNVKNEIVLKLYENSVATIGAGVIHDGILIGKITKVTKNAVIAKTIFDPEFRLSVRIGEKGVDALLVGGGTPKITLIPKDAVIGKGDVIGTASLDFPHGLPLGEIRDFETSRDGLFEEATILIPYDPSELKSVSIIQNQK
jgi:cell shape-determining protein MreC